MRLFTFELKKILFSRRFLYTFVILLCVTVGLFFRNVAFQELALEEESKRVTAYTQEAQSLLRTLQKAPESESINEQVQHLARALNLLYEWSPLVKSPDWKNRLQVENDFLATLTLYKTAGGDFSIPNEEIAPTIAFNEQLLAKGIEPTFEGYSTKLPNYMQQIANFYINIGAIILLLLVVGDLLTMEFEQGSIRLLSTQPIRKTAIIHAKWATSIVIYLILTLGLFAIAWGVGYLFGEAGSFAYPVALESGSFITIQEYMLWGLLSTTVVMLLVISLLLLSSLFIKNAIVTLLVIAGILMVGFFGLQALPFTQQWFNPFLYVFAGMSIQQVGESWYQSIAITVVLAVFLYSVTLLRMQRMRDMS
ncbi:ABC transporter permease subunit [Metasolibacillus meyeri]|uniref:ABC transporter permease subunit n=1 Tax=Metasolibacillus meyeri TaxID=1071052 RepID=A0AAW9NUY2_9BACL|nr:ABC transporter permease subunit [Metasolibacillus meyeri]MEC1178330.1 ABC transporter permease subunit [Metasolibacillus meyeri]